MTISNPKNFWCIGRNFADHAAELNNPIPQKPLIFLKSGACLQSGPELVFPDFLNDDVHYELEIVLLLGENLAPTHWTLGLDFTARDIQNEMKQLGQPWTLAKSFTGAAALGPWQPIQSLSDLDNLEFTLKINGLQKQRGQVTLMLFKFDKLLQYLKARFPLQPGEALFTGTPAGVGPLKKGDALLAQSGALQIQWYVK